MPALDVRDPKVIKFLLENYEKETFKRLSWINKHREKIQLAATLQREAKNYEETDVIAYTMAEGMAAITRDHKSSGLNRREVRRQDLTNTEIKSLRHGYSIVDLGLGDPKEDPKLARPDTDYTPDPIMRPVDQKLKEMLYKSIPEDGSKAYLKERTKIAPDEKFYLPECSSWEYGWRTKDSALLEKVAHPKNCQLMRELKSRVGPQPDPTYYQSPDIERFCYATLD